MLSAPVMTARSDTRSLRLKAGGTGEIPVMRSEKVVVNLFF